MANPVYEDALDQLAKGRTPTSGNVYLDDILQERQTVTPPKPPPPAPPKPVDNPYLDDILIDQREKEARLRMTVSTAPDVTPSRASFIRGLSQKFGLPSEVILRNYEHYQQLAPSEQSRAILESPGLTDWLSRQDRVTVGAVKGDLAALSGLERVLRNGSRAAMAGTAGIGTSILNSLRSVFDLTGGIPQEFQAGLYRAGGIGRAGAAVDAALAGGVQATLRGDTSDQGFVERAIYGGVESVFQNLPGLAAGVATGGAALPLTWAGAMTAGTALGEARQEGLSGAQAARYAATQSAVEVATEFIPATWLFKDLARAAPIIQTLMRQFGGETVGEQVATLVQDFDDWLSLPSNATKTAAQFVAERPSAAAATFISTAVAVGLTTSGASLAARVLEQAGKDAEQSTTVKDLPDVAVDLLKSALAGTPLQDVFVDIGTFTEFFQTKGIDPAVMAATVTGSPTAYADAQQTGEALKIPGEGYIVHIQSKPEFAALKDEIRRTTPEATNAREEAELAEKLSVRAETADAAAGDAGAPPANVAAPVSRPIHAAALQQFTEGGRIPAKVAEHYATLIDAAFTRLAQPLGLDPVALYQRYGLTVIRRLSSEVSKATALTQKSKTLFQKVKAAVAKVTGQAAKPQTLTPAFQLWFGKSKVKTAAGPMVVYHGTDQDFDTFDPDASGSGSLAADASGAFFFTSRADVAEDFAGYVYRLNENKEVVKAYTPGANIKPVYVKLENPDVWDMSGGSYTEEFLTEKIAEAKAGGADGVIFTNMRDGSVSTVGPWKQSHIVVAFKPEQIKSAIGNQGTFDPNNPNILLQGERAALRISDDQLKRTMVLFEGAGLDSVIHESAHLFLDVFADIATEVAAIDAAQHTPEQAKQLTDFSSLLTWMEYEGSLADWMRLTTDEKRPHHEKFAEAFVNYARDGKAPSPSLRGAFAQFRIWFKRLAKHLLPTVNFSPEVRQVIDRMLATDAAIAAVAAESGLQPMFLTAEDMGYTPEKFAAYADTIVKAEQQTVERLETRLFDEVRRETKAEWKARRAEIQARVTEDVYAEPVYIAISAISKGRTPAGLPMVEGQDPVPMKLNREALGARGVDIPSTLTISKGGHSADVLAEQFGYDSGDALLTALSTAEPMGRKIARQTSELMLAEHGSILLDGTLHDEARAAIANDVTQAVVLEELKALLAVETAEAKATGKPSVRRGVVPWRGFFDGLAEARLARTQVKDLHPRRFWVAARQASKDATEAAASQKFAKAIEAKQRELLNWALFKQASERQAEFKELVRDWKRDLFKPDDTLAKTRNMDYVLVARALVAPLIQSTKQTAIADALAVLRKMDPQMGEFIDDTLGFTPDTSPMADRTVQEILAIAESVGAIWDKSRREGQIEIGGKLMDRKDAIVDLNERQDTFGPGKFKGIGVAGQASGPEKFHQVSLGAKAWGRRVESWVTAMDGGPSGPFRTYVWEPVKTKIDLFRTEKVKAFTSYKALLDTIQDSLTADKIAAPEIGYTFGNNGSGGKAELLGALLHTGNRTAPTSNMAKLLVGRGWGAMNQADVLSTQKWDQMIARFHQQGILTKADHDFVQGVWDLFETMKPGLQKAHRTVYGTYFKEVAADAFDTPFGRYRGGYVPAIADPIMSKTVAIRNEKQMTFETGTSYALPSVGRKSTISRQRVFEPLAINLAFIPSHIDWALRFTHIQPAVQDVTKIVTDKTFREVLDAHDPEAGAEMLLPWLMRAATQRINQQGGSAYADRIFTALRTRTSLQVLSYNVNNALQQLTGIVVARAKVKRRYLANATYRYLRSPKQMGQEIRDSSPFMETFLTSQAIEILQQVDNIVLNPSVYGKSAEYLRSYNQVLASSSQNIVNHIVWLGARDQAEAEGVHGKEAVKRADSVVRETQGSFFPEDLARLEANTPFMRLFTMFSPYFNMLANLQTTEVGNALRSDRGAWMKAQRVASVSLLAVLIPSWIAQAILNTLRDDWNDDDDDTHIDEILNFLIGSPVKTAFSMVPIVGQFGQAIYGSLFTDARYDDDIRSSPVASVMGSAVRSLSGDTSAKQATRDALNILGLVFNLPLGALGKPIGYLIDVSQGKTEPEGPVDAVRGLVSGSGGRD